MKTVKVIKDLVIEYAQVYDSEEFYKFDAVSLINLQHLPDRNAAVNLKSECKTHLVPIHHYCYYTEKTDPRCLPKEYDRKDTYFVWSPQAEELIDIPLTTYVETMKQQEGLISNLNREISVVRERRAHWHKVALMNSKENCDLHRKFETASLWKRLKYLFTGEI